MSSRAFSYVVRLPRSASEAEAREKFLAVQTALRDAYAPLHEKAEHSLRSLVGAYDYDDHYHAEFVGARAALPPEERAALEAVEDTYWAAGARYEAAQREAA